MSYMMISFPAGLDSSRYPVRRKNSGIGAAFFGVGIATPEKVEPTIQDALDERGSVNNLVLLWEMEHHCTNEDPPAPGEIQRLLTRFQARDDQAASELLQRFYRELHEIAVRYMRQERSTTPSNRPPS